MTINMLFGLFGGMAMLLYGMRLVGEGLQLAAGGKLRHVLGTLTSNRVKGLLAGAGITAIIQSSGATTVMLVSFASSGLITLPQTLGVILGADIGTTLTVQLIAFQIADSSQGLSVMNCCSFCESTPKRSAMGPMDLRCPGMSNPST